MEAQTNIYQALMQAQKDMGPLLKNATNPAFRSKYADLGAVIETITEPLHDNGLVFYQVIDTQEGSPVLKTTIVQVTTQEMIESICPIVSKDPNDPQKMGAAITYARRYSLMSLLALAPEDDDGNAAAQPRTQEKTSATKPATAPVANKTFDDGYDYPCEVEGCHNTQEGSWASRCYTKYGKVYCGKHWKLAKDGLLDNPKENVETRKDIEYYGEY